MAWTCPPRGRSPDAKIATGDRALIRVIGYAAPQREPKLNLAQLMGKFTRLRAELASAYSIGCFWLRTPFLSLK